MSTPAKPCPFCGDANCMCIAGIYWRANRGTEGAAPVRYSRSDASYKIVEYVTRERYEAVVAELEQLRAERKEPQP